MPGEMHFEARMGFFVWLQFFSYCHICPQCHLGSHDRTGGQPLKINRNVECAALEHTEFWFCCSSDFQHDILQSKLMLGTLIYSFLNFSPLAPVVRVQMMWLWFTVYLTSSITLCRACGLNVPLWPWLTVCLGSLVGLKWREENW